MVSETREKFKKKGHLLLSSTEVVRNKYQRKGRVEDKISYEWFALFL